MKGSLLRATLTLLLGGALAQALPLLLGPWITRLYSPQAFGHFSLVWTLATNLAVVGCARYEFALPLAQDDGEASLLMGLCLRVLAVVLAVAAVVGGVLAMARGLDLFWWLPLAVLAGAATQWLTLWATRAQEFRVLAIGRVTQYGGGAVLQVGLGLLQWGAQGLLAGPVLAGIATAWLLARPSPQGGWRTLLRQAPAALREVARRHRDFPLLNTPHAFAGALQDSLALILITAWSGDASAGYWALSLRYLKAPASLVGSALSQALYPRLVAARESAQALHLVRSAMGVLLLLAAPLMIGLMLWGPWVFAVVFGTGWRDAGELARALAPYIAMHFVAAPLAVVTMAWGAQAWALKLALVGQVAYVGGLALGLHWGGLMGAAWGVSAAMLLYFGYYFWTLAHWRSFP